MHDPPYTDEEVEVICLMHRQGATHKEIAKVLNRKFNSVTNKISSLIRYKKLERREHVRNESKSKCWECKRSMVSCKKPVEGWVAEKSGDSYIVIDCPKYEDMRAKIKESEDEEKAC